MPKEKSVNPLGENPTQLPKQEFQNNPEVLIEKVNKDRKESIEFLEKTYLWLREHLPEKKFLRKATSAFANILTALVSLNAMVDMIISDLIKTTQGVQQQARAGWQLSSVVQVLIELLEKKEVITSGEVEEAHKKFLVDLKEAEKKTQETQKVEGLDT